MSEQENVSDLADQILREWREAATDEVQRAVVFVLEDHIRDLRERARRAEAANLEKFVTVLDGKNTLVMTKSELDDLLKRAHT